MRLKNKTSETKLNRNEENNNNENVIWTKFYLCGQLDMYQVSKTKGTKLEIKRSRPNGVCSFFIFIFYVHFKKGEFVFVCVCGRVVEIIFSMVFVLPIKRNQRISNGIYKTDDMELDDTKSIQFNSIRFDWTGTEVGRHFAGANFVSLDLKTGKGITVIFFADFLLLLDSFRNQSMNVKRKNENRLKTEYKKN